MRLGRANELWIGYGGGGFHNIGVTQSVVTKLDNVMKELGETQMFQESRDRMSYLVARVV